MKRAPGIQEPLKSWLRGIVNATDALDLLTGVPDESTAPVALIVPTRGKRSGGRAFALRTRTAKGAAQSKLRLVCDPAR